MGLRRSGFLAGGGQVSAAQALVVLLALTLVFLTVVLVVEAMREVDARARTVARTLIVQQLSSRLITIALEAETGQRGFLLTGDRQFLDVLSRSGARVRSTMRRLEELTSEDPRQFANAQRLGSLVDLRLQLLHHPVRLQATEGPLAAVIAVRSGSGRDVMQRARALADSLVRHQERVLEQQEVRLQQAVRRAWNVGGLVVLAVAIPLAFLVRAQRLRREAELALARGRLLDRVLNAASTMVIVQERVDGRVVAVSRAFCDMLGESEDATAVHAISNAIHPSDRQLIDLRRRHLIESKAVGVPYEIPIRMRAADGSWRSLAWCEAATAELADGSVGMFVATASDVTAARTRELQQRHTLKMEALGQLAGGIAHDINNMAAVIAGNVSLLLSGRGGADGLAELEEIRQTTGRLGAMSRELLQMSRRDSDDIRPRPIDLNAVVAGGKRLIAHALRETEVAYRCSTEGIMVIGEELALERGLLNLAVNARDALAGQSDGRVVVRTELVRLEGPLSHHLGLVPAGSYGVLEVSDNGPGVPSDLLARIFDPFFTTKPEGKGSGLGLAILSNVVNQCGGFVTVNSEQGRGAVFRVYLRSDASGLSVSSRDVTGDAV